MAEQYIEILDEQEELERVNELNNRELHLQYIICIKMKETLKRNKRDGVKDYKTKFQESQFKKLKKYLKENYSDKDVKNDEERANNIKYHGEQKKKFRQICNKNNELIAEFASIIEAIKQQRPNPDYNKKIMCKACNCEISKACIARHNKSEKHLKKIEIQKANKINTKK